MKPEIITVEMNLKGLIAETREVIQALSDFADNIERIDKKYNTNCESVESEEEYERNSI